MKKAILFEVGTEELPASQIGNITESLHESLSQNLIKTNFILNQKMFFLHQGESQ